MSSYYAYQNSLNDYENRMRDYSNQKAALLHQFSPNEIARGLTSDVAPLVMAETGLHGGKAFMNNVREALKEKARGAVQGARDQMQARVGDVQDQAAEALQSARTQAGDFIDQGMNRAAETATRATAALRNGVAQARAGVADAQAQVGEAVGRAREGAGDLRLAANRRWTQASTEGRQWLVDVNRQNEYDRVTANGLRRMGQPELADRYSPMRRVRTIRETPEEPLGGEEPVDVGAEVAARRAGAAEGRAVLNRVRGRYLRAAQQRAEAERAEQPRDVGDVAQDRIPAETRGPVAEQLNQAGNDVDAQIADATGSRLRMLNATKARINRAQSAARGQAEDPEDVANDLLPSRPQLVEDTRLDRLGRLSSIRQNALEEASRLRNNADLAAELGRLRNEPPGYRNAELDSRAARTQSIADDAQRQIEEIGSEPNPNDLTEQAYHDGMDDAKLGVDRSANYTDAMNDAYTQGAADMKNYQSVVDAHEALAKANVADTGEGAAGDVAADTIEAGLEGAGEATGAETGGLGYLVAGAVALGSELAAKFTDKPDIPIPEAPTFARFSGSAGVM